MDFFHLMYFLLMLFYADAGYFFNTPETVRVPYTHDTEYKVWENITAIYDSFRNCTELSCRFNLGQPDCREVVKTCSKSVPYDRCDLSYNPQDMFYVQDLTIIKRPCSVSDCRNTCPGSSCLSPGTTVTVEVRCWSSEDESAGNETTTFNITSVLGSPLSSCPLLTVPHGILSSADTRHCNNVKISCIQDYNLIGESALTCCNGTWNAAPPTCHKGCKTFSVSNGMVLTKDTDNGPLATVICHNGYSLTESPTVSCTDGVWSKQSPNCYADCKTLTIPNGKVTDARTSHGTQTEVTCNGGYSLSGTSTLTCSNGSWTDVFPTCRRDCPKVSVPNGNVYTISSHGTQLDITCNRGYSLSGPQIMVCTDGIWNTHPPVCFRECEANTFGQNCTSVCDCMANNTVTPEQPCDPDSGKCRCLPNWEGERCYVDVDECQRGLHDCDVTRAICHNVPGGFQCTDRQAVVLDKNDGVKEYIIPVSLGSGIFFLLLAVLASLLTWRRLKRKRQLKPEDGEISYVDLDILQDKDLRSRNDSHASEDSGYFERCWDNPIHKQTGEFVPTPGPSPQEPAPGPCPAWPGQEVDWDREDLTYL